MKYCFFYTCMLHYFFLIYISYICIDVILIFFVFILKADQRGTFFFTFVRITCYLEYIWFTHNIFYILQHDWRCNIDYSPLWSAFKMKTKNYFWTIVCTCTRYHCFLEISSRYIHSLNKYVDIVNSELIESILIWTLIKRSNQ
jgi:hypothetical protein